MPIDPLQRWQYKLSFDLKIRSSYGTAFQDFFSTVMEKLHADDFIRVRPFGAAGDKGCDGYLSTSGQVFQCYGKLEDSPPNVAIIVKKLDDDYRLASDHLKQIMKEWHFSHNLVNGLPTDAVLKIEAMKKAHPKHEFGVVGPAGLEDRVFKLEMHQIIELLGPAATAQDTRNLRIEEVRDLVATLMATIDTGSVIQQDIRPVPRDKLTFNQLPHHWSGLIIAASQNGPYVRRYLEQHADPEIGDKLAKIFSERYRELKQQNLEPGTIMDNLYEQITGIGRVSTQRQVAAQALLGYLFDSCDIFEDKPVRSVS